MALAPVLPVAEGYPELPNREGHEYLDGRWVKIPMGAESAWVAFQLLKQLDTFVATYHLGVVLQTETPVQIWPEYPRRFRKPDGAFVSLGKLPGDRVPVGMVQVPPDLVIESLSPTDRGEDIDQKIAEYFDAGVRLVWVLVPRTRTVHVHRPDGTAARLSERDTLTGEDIVPGFTVSVASLFQRP